jgi:hypothetical protein
MCRAVPRIVRRPTRAARGTRLPCAFGSLVPVILLGAATCIAPGTAQAGCSGGAVRFNPARNDTVEAQFTVDQSGCRMNYPGKDKSVTLSFDLAAEPRNGTLEKDENGAVVYTPRKGFEGEDRYLLKICADKAGRRIGCSSLNYRVTVVAKPILPQNLTAAQKCILEVNERYGMVRPEFGKIMVDGAAYYAYQIAREKCMALAKTP